MARGIDHLILASPFEEPKEHWSYDRETRCFVRKEGRREAGYVVATPGADSFDDPGIFFPIELVNRIRPRVRAWREEGYPGVTGITKRLLEHWQDPELFESRRFFFCQLEAIETLIWMTEAPVAERQGIEVEGDGGDFRRLCAKMATGTGKTLVMAMAIAWQILNKVESPQDRRFAKHVLVVAPGLTVRNRLQVLIPAEDGNYYEHFDIVPGALRERLRQGKVLVRNWHALDWESEEQLKKRRSVDKRGAKSDEAYVRAVLGDLASARNLLVINDEAHHAWRVPSERRVSASRAEREEATKWVGGLDRIHRARGILTALDFSATPFAPTGKRSDEHALFPWIVSDFGLSDAIESGLVKTPRIAIRDDGVPEAKTFRSKLFHIYAQKEVHEDLNRKAKPEEPLPKLVTAAYQILGNDWHATAEAWKAENAQTPPVMITVANRTETAARIAQAFQRGRIDVPGLGDPERMLHIDTKVLEQAEAKEEAEPDTQLEEAGDSRGKLTKQQQAELLRRQVDTVGRPGEPGEKIHNVISVGMLSEGWDAKTVTHIMGLRAFTSQLLCEQVVGRGLRRTSYELEDDGFFKPEFVNVLGVPFTFLPHEGDEDARPTPTKPRTRVEPLSEKKQYEISWPNVIRIDTVYGTRLRLDLDRLPRLEIDAHETPQIAEMAPTVGGKADVTRVRQIDLEELGRRKRFQTLVFEAAASVFDQAERGWSGKREALLGQIIPLVERFLASEKVAIRPEVYARDPLRRRILLALNLPDVVQHVFEGIRAESTESRELVLDRERPLRCTGDMVPWWTAKPCHKTERSHINFCVHDSTWEAGETFRLDRDPHVAAWAKNEHLGFEIHYLYQGAVRRYRPDFLIRLANGTHLVLEVKGRDSPQNRSKRQFLAEWIDAVNEDGRFGRWAWDVSFNPSDVSDVLDRHGA